MCESPKCDKCGKEVTTGLMAAFCEEAKECAFYVPELDDFMTDLGYERNPALTQPQTNRHTGG
jgi:hypothetical protein